MFRSRTSRFYRDIAEGCIDSDLPRRGTGRGGVERETTGAAKWVTGHLPSGISMATGFSRGGKSNFFEGVGWRDLAGRGCSELGMMREFNRRGEMV